MPSKPGLSTHMRVHTNTHAGTSSHAFHRPPFNLYNFQLYDHEKVIEHTYCTHQACIKKKDVVLISFFISMEPSSLKLGFLTQNCGNINSHIVGMFQ